MNPILNHELIEGLDTNFLEFQNSNVILKALIRGRIVNSVPSSNDKENLLKWKQTIAKTVYQKKIPTENSHEDHYAVSLNMRFDPKNKHSKKLDVENYAKPIIDGIAMGLFSKNNDFDKTVHFNQDDSNFNFLYIERSNDVSSPTEEGVVIVVSKIIESENSS